MSEPWSLDGYELEVLLGFGATGEVWRARESATGDVVALKRLREGADPLALEALRREASLLRTLDTPYVVRLRAVIGEVLVLDHAPGGSLAGLLARRGVLDPGEVVTIGVPLAQALACAHGLGLVHGDVSPSNVLLTADGMPLLADLGVARVAGEQLATVDGTAEYVDPAVAAGGEPDAAADVWALAALCHHLLAGTPPHDGDSAGAVLEAAVAGERAPLGLLAPAAPRALVAAVEAALVADPAQRPDAAAFGSLLRQAQATAPVRLSAGVGTYGAVRETHVVRPAPVPPPARRPRLDRLSGGLLTRGAPGSADQAGKRLPGRVPRAALPVVVLLALVVLAAGVGWASGRAGIAAAVVPPLAGSAGPAAGPALTGPSPGTSPGPAPPARSASPASTAAPASSAPPASPLSPASPALPPFPAPPAAEPVDAAGWRPVLDGLDGARARAFAAADPALLQSVWAPGSPGLVADAALLAQLARAGQHAVGLRHALREVQVQQSAVADARLRVVDILAAHEVLDADGAVVRRFAERGSEAWVVALTRTAAGWRLASVAQDG